MKIKQYLALFLALAMLVSVITLNAAAADTVTFEAIDGSGIADAKEGYSKLIDGDTGTK